MSTNTVTNWFGNLVSHPSVIVEAHSVDDIVTTITDPVRCPSPVRAVGSNHSTARCGVADGGALIRMNLNQVLKIRQDSVTVQTDATNIEMAKALEAKSLKFYVTSVSGCPFANCHIPEPDAPVETTSSCRLIAASRLARRRLTITARVASEAMLEEPAKGRWQLFVADMWSNHYNCLDHLGNGARAPGAVYLQSAETPSSAS
jgi:hypothetical protein